MKVGIIGTGAVANTHVEAFQAVGMDVVGVYGRNQVKLDEFASKWNIGSKFNDINDFLGHEYDLVSIATSSDTHLIFYKLVVEKTNSYILLEKPVALNLVEAEEILKLKAENRTIVGHQVRLNPNLRKAREIIKLGQIGGVKSVHIETFLHHNDENNEFSWYDDVNKGGGQTNLVGVHMYDLAIFLLGHNSLNEKLWLKNQLSFQKKNAEGEVFDVTTEQQMSALIRFNNETDVFLFNTCYAFSLRKISIDILGDKGILRYDDVSGLRLVDLEGEHSVDIEDKLAHIQTGRSLFSKSYKYLAEEIKNIILNKRNVLETDCANILTGVDFFRMLETK